MNELHERFNRLFDEDGKTRWRIISLSAGATALYGFAHQLAGAKIADVQRPATIIGVAVFTAQILVYSVRPGLARRLAVRTKTYVIRSAMAIATSALLAVIASISASAVQAAILNRRLKIAVESIAAKPETNFQEVRHIFSSALDSPAKLQDDLVARATQVLSKQSTPGAWEAYVAIVEYIVNWRSNEWNEDGLDWHVQRLEKLTKDAPLCGPKNSGINVGQFSTKNGKITHFTNVSQWPTTIAGCRLVLDGMPLSNTQIGYAIIKYDGGPVSLDNVRLFFVKLELEDNPGTRKFAADLLKSQDNVLTLKYD